jgi:hypothetical protein
MVATIVSIAETVTMMVCLTAWIATAMAMVFPIARTAARTNLKATDAKLGRLGCSITREHIPQPAQGGGDIEAGIGQRFTGHDFFQRHERICFAGQQDLGAPFLHVAHKTVTGAGGNHDFHAMKGMGAIVLKMVRQLLFGEQDTLGLGQWFTRLAVEYQPVPGLAGMAANLGPVVLGGDRNFHDF